MGKSIAQIKEEYQVLSRLDWNRDDITDPVSDFLTEYEQDERSGVQAFIKRAKKLLADYETEKKRIDALCMYEKQYPDCDLICAGMAIGEKTVHGVACSEDILATMDCLRALGAACEVRGSDVTVRGYTLEEEVYLQCAQAFADFPTVSTADIGAYQPKASFSFLAENGQCTPDPKELHYKPEE